MLFLKVFLSKIIFTKLQMFSSGEEKYNISI